MKPKYCGKREVVQRTKADRKYWREERRRLKHKLRSLDYMVNVWARHHGLTHCYAWEYMGTPEDRILEADLRRWACDVGEIIWRARKARIEQARLDRTAASCARRGLPAPVRFHGRKRMGNRPGGAGL